jgi:hypothetical protein
MKRLLPLLLLLIAVLSYSFKPAENNLRYFVQFKINTIETLEQVNEINKKMLLHSGIEASRADHITSTYFCYLKSGVDYNQKDFENWFKELNLSISCFNKGIDNKDKVINPYILKDCENEK